MAAHPPPDALIRRCRPCRANQANRQEDPARTAANVLLQILDDITIRFAEQTFPRVLFWLIPEMPLVADVAQHISVHAHWLRTEIPRELANMLYPSLHEFRNVLS